MVKFSAVNQVFHNGIRQAQYKTCNQQKESAAQNYCHYIHLMIVAMLVSYKLIYVMERVVCRWSLVFRQKTKDEGLKTVSSACITHASCNGVNTAQ